MKPTKLEERLIKMSAQERSNWFNNEATEQEKYEYLYNALRPGFVPGPKSDRRPGPRRTRK
jgi:hypothetical protein